MKRLAAALALVVTAGLGTAHAEPKAAPVGPLSGGDDLAAALALEDRLGAISLHEGHAVPVDLDAAGVPAKTGGWGDSGLWTGVYEGGEALRYAVARDHAARSTGQEKQFWRDQKDAALARLRSTLAAEHRDIVIAQDWTGHLKVPPTVNTGTDPKGEKHLADFGGGVIPGEAGMIMRACTTASAYPLGVDPPTQDDANPINNNSNRLFQIRWTHGDGKLYNCETSPSRDTYAGLTFGLLTAYDMLGNDAPDLRDQIRADLVAMGNFLFKYGWNYPRPHGYVSANHDFDGFISPLFVYVPMARLNLTNAVVHVLADGDDPVERAKWQGIWAEELATQGPVLAASMEVDSVQPNDGYYKFNLHHLTGFNLMRTTAEPARSLVKQAISVMDKTTGDDLNAHFEAITYAMTGEPGRLDAAVQHLREWRVYKARVERGEASSVTCSTVTCVRKDQYGVVTPAGEIDWFPGTSGDKRAALPLPVVDRAPSDFIWQREPTVVNGKSEPTTHREPAIDYLTPYWMLRYETEVAQPALSPLPPWPGPAHV
ncbi:MAG: hypothetical protein ABR549_16630 [Mycobacteriales bacterium]